jgi:hypothetical protein
MARAGACSGYGRACDPRQQARREQHQPPAGPEQLPWQLAARESALHEWNQAFGTGGYRASNGLTDREIGTLQSPLRP